VAYYLKGIGDKISGVNEILPQLDARMINFLVGVQHGIITGELNSFGFTTIDRGIRIRSGLLQAWGYFAMSDTDVQFNFTTPSGSVQFVQIYAEIDLSKAPQVFEIKVTAQSSSNSFTPQQDNLRTNPNGKFQFWLFTAQLNTNNTISVTDRRTYLTKPLNAVNADFAVTQAQSDNSTRVATTSYVRQAVSDALNISSAPVMNGLVQVGTVRRQANFVVVNITGAASTNMGVIPEGFRPKTTIAIGGSGNLSGGVAATWPGSDNMYGSIAGYIYTSGQISLTGSAFGGWTSPNGGAGMATVSLGAVSINAGYEIT
jgi:hypothetical protein